MAVILVAFIFVLAGLWSRTSLVVGKDVKLTLVLLVCEQMDRCVIYWEVFNTLFIGGVIFFIYFCHTSLFEASFSHHGDTGGAPVTGQCTCGHCVYSHSICHTVIWCCLATGGQDLDFGPGSVMCLRAKNNAKPCKRKGTERFRLFVLVLVNDLHVRMCGISRGTGLLFTIVLTNCLDMIK